MNKELEERILDLEMELANLKRALIDFGILPSHEIEGVE